MRKNFILIISAISFALLMSSPTFASPMPPMPECKIKAEVIENNIDYNPYTQLAKEQGIAKSTPGWTIIRILETDEEPVVDSSFANENYCTEQYVKGEEITLHIEEEYSEGAIISGVISMSGDEWGTWHSFESIEKISKNDVFEDSTEDVINDDKQQDSNAFYLMAIFAGVTIVLIILGLFLLRRK